SQVAMADDVGCGADALAGVARTHLLDLVADGRRCRRRIDVEEIEAGEVVEERPRDGASRERRPREPTGAEPAAVLRIGRIAREDVVARDRGREGTPGLEAAGGESIAAGV